MEVETKKRTVNSFICSPPPANKRAQSNRKIVHDFLLPCSGDRIELAEATHGALIAGGTPRKSEWALENGPVGGVGVGGNTSNNSASRSDSLMLMDEDNTFSNKKKKKKKAVGNSNSSSSSCALGQIEEHLAARDGQDMEEDEVGEVHHGVTLHVWVQHVFF